MSKKFWPFLYLGPLLAATLIVFHVYYLVFIRAYQGPDVKFFIPQGAKFAQIDSRLYDEKLISNPRLFHYYAKIRKADTKFKAGTYLIKTGMNMEAVLKELAYGKSLTLPITIPEGKNIYEVASILEEAKIVNAQDFIALAKEHEGYLFPETYYLEPGFPAEQVIKAMLKEFEHKTKNFDFSEGKNLPIPLTKEEIIVLASMVEKETGAKSERAMIAGVFYNRLLKHMRLQSDPTTIYGLYDEKGGFDGNISRSDLLHKTPYNTYTIPALPKGPICNPGLESIAAVLKPAQHDYLYFVSHNDGTHQFSRSYDDHLHAVAHFQRDKNAREGKSWRQLKDK